MHSDSGPVLIAAVTGRALAASARRAGMPVVVLDYFADRDTCALATACRSVVSAHGLRFDRRSILSAADELAPKAASSGLVFGSGFEGRIPLLARLSGGRRLFGNSPSVVSAVRRPETFFPLLDRLGIAHPEVRYNAPADPAGWLTKEPGGAGGTRVRPAGRGRIGSTTYFQRHMPGTACSALFLANGRRAFVVGFNQQWTSSAHPALPFLYGGAVGGFPVPTSVECEIRDRLDALVETSGLVGLNGVDFLLDGASWSVLEVNPRPTATMELYDADYDRGLLDAHLRACTGELPVSMPPGRMVRASMIVHATRAWQVVAGFEFPEWCRDLPHPGTRFTQGDPVCTVHAEAPTAESAVSLVRERQREVEQAFSDPAAMTVAP
jgi:uncharacterized protein